MGCSSSQPVHERAANGPDSGLFSAVKSGRAVDVQAALSTATRRVDDFRDGKQQHTLLHTAVRHMQPQVVKVLLDNGAQPSLQDMDGRTALHLLVHQAAQQPQRLSAALEIQRAILDSVGRASVSAVDMATKEGTPLLMALELNMEQLARVFLEYKCSPVAVNGGRDNALHLAIATGNVSLVKAVMQVGTELNVLQQLCNAQNAQGATPLHRAVALSMIEAVQQLLILPFININVPDAQGNTPLTVALLALLAAPTAPHVSSIARALLKSGGAVDAINKNVQTPVSLAVDLACRIFDGQGDVPMRVLIEPLASMAEGHGRLLGDKSGAVFNMLGRQGLAAVHVAARMGSIPMLNGLANRNADLDLVDGSGQLPTVLAAQAGHKAAVLCLLGNLAADPLALDQSGMSLAAHVLQAKPGQYSPTDLRDIMLAIVRSPRITGQHRLDTTPVTIVGTPAAPGALPLLHLACVTGAVETVHMLITEAGLSPEAQSPGGAAPLGLTVAAYCAEPNPDLLAVVDFLIKNGCNPLGTQGGAKGAKPLAKALDAGHLDLALSMLRVASRNVNFSSPSGATALYLALVQGHVGAARELIHTLKASVTAQPGFTPLHVAVGCRAPRLVELLLAHPEASQTVNDPDVYNMTAIDYLWRPWKQDTLGPSHVPKGAVPEADPTALEETARLLLRAAQCNPNVADAEGRRPLHLAVLSGQPALVRAFGSAAENLDPNLPDGAGFTPLFAAVQKGDLLMVQAMLESLPGLKLETTCKVPGAPEGRTPLQQAVHLANVPMVALIAGHSGTTIDLGSLKLCLTHLDKPAVSLPMLSELLHASRDKRRAIDLSSQVTALRLKNKLEVPALHYAAHNNQPEAVRLLIERANAPIEGLDVQGMTALHHAVEGQAYAAAQELINLGANPSAMGKMGTSPLIRATQAKDAKMVALLLNAPVPYDVDATDSGGCTALTVTVQALLNYAFERGLERDRAAQAAAAAVAATPPSHRIGQRSGDWGARPSFSQLSSAGSLGNPGLVSVRERVNGLIPPALPEHSELSSASVGGASSIGTLSINGRANSRVLGPSVSMAGPGGIMTAREEIFWSLVEAGADVNKPMSQMATTAVAVTPASAHSGSLGPAPSNAASALTSASSASGPLSGTPAAGNDPEVITPLIAAIQFRCQSVLDVLLTVPDLDVAGRHSAPALHVALQGVQGLLESHLARQGREVSFPPAPAPTTPVPLGRSLITNITRKHRAHDPAPVVPGSNPMDALHTAVAILRRIALDERCDYTLALSNTSGLTPLMALAEMGSPDARSLVYELVSQVPPRELAINAVLSTNRRTALHTAALKGDATMVEALASAPGVDFNLLDDAGHSPLACAVLSGSCDAIRALLLAARRNTDAVGALDPCACGKDPRGSPMALAVAHPEAAPLRTLLSEMRAANELVVATGAEGLTAGIEQVNSAIRSATQGTTTTTAPAPAADANANGNAAAGVKTSAAAAALASKATTANGDARPVLPVGSKYDIAAFLQKAVDASGRSPVLVAMKGLKLDHAEALATAGAPLDVAEPDTSTRNHSSLEKRELEGHLAKCTPLHMLLQYIVELEGEKKGEKHRGVIKQASSLAAIMAMQPSMVSAVSMQDLTGFTVLHWAVLARLDKPPGPGEKCAVELLSAIARKAGTVNTAASTPNGKGFTALHLAAQLGHVESARYLLVLGDAKVDVETSDGQTPILLSRTEELRELLRNPPGAVAAEELRDDVSEAGSSLPEIRKQALVVAGLKGIQAKFVYAWSHMKGVPDLDKSHRAELSSNKSMSVSVKEGKVVVNNTAGETMGDTTATALYGAFRAAVKGGIAVGVGLGPIGAALAAVCSIADQILDNMELVVINNIIVAHICGRIKRQLPTLQKLKTRCENWKGESREGMAEVLMGHIANLGEVYISVHEKVQAWASTGKASLISRMLSSKEYYDDFMQLEMILTACMTDLGTSITTYSLLDNFKPETADKAQVEADVRAAIKMDMQLAVRDILDAEAAGADEQQNRLKKLFHEYGLDYTKLRHHERKRWRNEKLRDLLVPYDNVKVVALYGTGGTARVYEARWQGHPVAYKQFEALPGMVEGLMDAVEKEGYIMSTLRHPNVIQAFGIVADKQRNQYGLLVDFHPRGSLQSIIDAADKRRQAAKAGSAAQGAPVLSVQERVVLVAQVARGMAYLHGRAIEPIVHGDLKPSNVLLAEDGRAVITDFGLARVSSTTTTTRATKSHSDSFSSNASAVYTAPEVPTLLLDGLKRKPSSDVFSFGVLMYELLLLQPAYEGFATSTTDYMNRMLKGERPPIPSEIPEILRFCISQCWHTKPEERLKFSTVVSMLDVVISGFDGAGRFIA